jgi:transposase InsO family protein
VSPRATPQPVVDRILELRKALTEQGLDAGPHTICWHLAQAGITVSTATVPRILTRHGAITPDPRKRPKSSLRHFAAELPNQLWQADFTHWRLSGGRDVEILNGDGSSRPANSFANSPSAPPGTTSPKNPAKSETDRTRRFGLSPMS